MSYNRTIASCDSVDVVLRCPKTLGPVGLVGASEVRFLLAPRASGFKCLMWRAAVCSKFVLPSRKSLEKVTKKKKKIKIKKIIKKMVFVYKKWGVSAN